MADKTIIGLSGLMALQEAMDHVANNIANQTTTGYRAHHAAFSEYLKKEKNTEEAILMRAPTAMVDVRTVADLSSGGVRLTGGPLDAAIVGAGYFMVQTPNGPRYTRNGAFVVDSSGQLTTMTGDRVATASGATAPPNAEVTLGNDGQLSANGVPYNRLRLVTFNDPRQLQPTGAAQFQTTQQAVEIPGPSMRLVTGALEQSNVNAVMEVARMSEITRAYQHISATIMKNDGNEELARLAGTE